MKSVKTLTACLTMCLALVGCGQQTKEDTNAQDTHSPKKLSVVTTFTVIADIAQNVAGEAADVQSITKAGAALHGYGPTTQDVVRAQ